jgi:hypothetical protein
MEISFPVAQVKICVDAQSLKEKLFWVLLSLVVMVACALSMSIVDVCRCCGCVGETLKADRALAWPIGEHEVVVVAAARW